MTNMESNLRKVYEHPLAEEVRISPENVLCGNDSGTGGRGADMDVERDDL